MKSAKYERKEPAMRLLLKLLSNVVNDPSHEKYRTLRLDNATLSRDVFQVDGCLQFLEECGFRPEHDTRALTMSEGVASGADLKTKLSELEEFVQKQRLEQWRRERDAKIDRERALDAATLKPWRKAKSSNITLQLQTLTRCENAALDANATVEHLREVVAKTFQRSALQINMSLCNDNGSKKLVWDEARLVDVDVVEGSTITVNFGAEDEFLTEIAAKANVTDLRNNPFYPDADRSAKDCSWQFTQEVMAAAEERELMDPTRLKKLKRRLHARDLTMRQVRDEVFAWAEEGSLDDIRTKFLDKESCFKQKVVKAVEHVEIQEDRRKWAMMIADENRQGLLRACQRPHIRATAYCN